MFLVARQSGVTCEQWGLFLDRVTVPSTLLFPQLFKAHTLPGRTPGTHSEGDKIQGRQKQKRVIILNKHLMGSAQRKNKEKGLLPKFRESPL